MNENKQKLSPQKRKFVNFLKTLNYKKPKSAEIMKELDISKATFYRWLRDEKLLNLAQEENAVETEEQIHELEVALFEKARQGDVRAIKLFLERYDAVKKSKELTPDQLIQLARISVQNKKLKNENSI